MLLQHNRVRNYLGIEPSVQINFKCFYDKKEEVILKDEQATNNKENTKVHNELLAQTASMGQHSTSEPPEKVSFNHKFLRTGDRQPTNPPSEQQSTPTLLSRFPPSVVAALSQLTDADSKAIQASSTLTKCVYTLVFLASNKGKQFHLDNNSDKTTVIREPLSSRFQLSNSNPVVSPPSKLFENVSRSKLAKLERKAECFKSLNVKLNQKKAKMSNLSRRLYGVMMMMASKLNLEIAESICALAIAAYMNDCGFDIDKIGNSTPSASTLKEIMIEEALETVLLDREEM